MNNNNNKKGWKFKLWQSNLSTLVLVVLLIFSFLKVSKEVLLRYEINNEIEVLDTKLNYLKDKTEKMDNLIAYLQTDEYIEEEARLKLNLSKVGEKQINLASRPSSSIDFEEVDIASNINKWFDYFFKKI